MTRLRHHPQQVIDELLAWCAEHSNRQPGQVTAVGLAYVHGLNVHQIVNCRVLEPAPDLRLSFPAARRAREIADAPHSELRVAEPDWVHAAVATLARDRDTGSLLYPPGNRVGLPHNPRRIDELVRAAGKAATGLRITIPSLNSSRTASVLAAREPLALQGLGYSPFTIAALTTAHRGVILPRRAK